jgi:hypothetical protein
MRSWFNSGPNGSPAIFRRSDTAVSPVNPQDRADPVSLTQDFAHLQSISREEQQKQLRDLAVRGQLVTAIYIARRLYGSTLVPAPRFALARPHIEAVPDKRLPL